MTVSGALVMCGVEWATIMLHIALVVFVTIAPLVVPTSLVPWLIGFFPVVLLLYAMFGECPVTSAEKFARRQCRQQFPSFPDILPAISVNEPADDTMATDTAMHFFRRVVYATTGLVLEERDVMICIVIAWMYMYGVFLWRCGHVAHAFRVSKVIMHDI